jgi:hypothetical protein
MSRLNGSQMGRRDWRKYSPDAARESMMLLTEKAAAVDDRGLGIKRGKGVYFF